MKAEAVQEVLNLLSLWGCSEVGLVRVRELLREEISDPTQRGEPVPLPSFRPPDQRAAREDLVRVPIRRLQDLLAEDEAEPATGLREAAEQNQAGD